MRVRDADGMQKPSQDRAGHRGAPASGPAATQVPASVPSGSEERRLMKKFRAVESGLPEN